MALKGKRKTQDPCEGCFMHRDRCFCSDIPVLDLNTRITLVIHNRELRRTTNTGILATRALKNSCIVVRGLRENPIDFRTILVPDYQNLLLYPGVNSTPLNHKGFKKTDQPVNLIVPDGNWRQASKVHYRYSELASIQRVMVYAPQDASPRLRTENTVDGMATLQAIAYSMGVLEGSAAMAHLLTLYDLKLQRTIQGRGIRPT